MKAVKKRFEITINVTFERSVEDTEDALGAEMEEVQEAVSAAIANHVPKQFRGAMRVWISRSSMGNPA